MLDTKGPEIRTGDLADPTQKISLKKGQKIRLTSDLSVKCSPEVISFTYQELFSDLNVGSKILLADGNLTIRVLEKDQASKSLIGEVQNDFELGSKKNVNLPGVAVKLPIISPTDRLDLIDFGIKHKVDFVALSFTTSQDSVKICRDVLGEVGRHIKIISKIENQQGLSEVEGILQVSDGIMIARGDLGMEMDLQKMFVAQTYMTELARKHNKIAVVATQMLESMVQNSRPTRAEITDVGHAVWSMVDSTMLSGETGGGQYPAEAAETMNRIALETEAHITFGNQFTDGLTTEPEEETWWQSLKGSLRVLRPRKLANSDLAKEAVRLSIGSPVAGIIVGGGNEELVQMISSFRPGVPIFFFHKDHQVLNGIKLNYGVYPLLDQSGLHPSMAQRMIATVDFFKKNGFTDPHPQTTDFW